MNSTAKAIDNKEWLKQIIERMRFAWNNRFMSFSCKYQEQRKKTVFFHPPKEIYAQPKEHDRRASEAIDCDIFVFASCNFDSVTMANVCINWAIMEYLCYFFFFVCFVHVIASVNRISNSTEWHGIKQSQCLFFLSPSASSSSSSRRRIFARTMAINNEVRGFPLYRMNWMNITLLCYQYCVPLFMPISRTIHTCNMNVMLAVLLRFICI